MGRKKIPAWLVETVWYKEGNKYGIGHCWHCGRTIEKTHRTNQEDAWQVDHFPVKYSDIEGQLCCGITDPLEESNLVPSCKKCNMSHKFEKNSWCGRSQIPCRKSFWFKIVFIFYSIGIYMLGFITGTSYNK